MRLLAIDTLLFCPVAVPGWVAFLPDLLCIARLLLQYISVFAPGLIVFFARHHPTLHLTTNSLQHFREAHSFLANKQGKQKDLASGLL